MTTAEAVQHARESLHAERVPIQAVRLADDIALNAPSRLGFEVLFVARSEGYCQHCAPQQVVGNLVCILYRLGEKAVPVFRCAGHQQRTLDLGAER